MSGIELYSIGASIVLDNQIVSQLESVADQFGAIQGSVDKINAGLSTTRDLVSSIAGQTAALTSGFSAASDAASRMTSGAVPVTSGGGSGGGYVPISVNGGDPDQPRLDYYGGSLGQLTVIPGQGRYTPGDGGYQGPGEPDASMGGGGMPPINLNGGRGAGGGGFDPMHALSYMFMGQAAVNMAGAAARATTTPSFDVQAQLNQIGNMTPAGQDAGSVEMQAISAARAIQQKYPGISIGDALGMVTNFYSVDRNMDSVVGLASRYAQDNYAIGNITNNPNFQDQLYSGLRAGEDAGYFTNKKTGQLDPTKELQFLETATRLDVSSNGNITPTGLMTMIGQAGPEASQMSDRAMERAMVQQQALGNSQVGTGINALAQEFIGGKMSQATARSLHEAGVLPDYMFGPDGNIDTKYLVGSDGKSIAYSKDGRGKILNEYKYGIGQVMLPPGTLMDEQDALADPIGWAQTHLFGQFLDANGNLKPGAANEEGFIAAVNRDFSRLPGGKLVGNAIINDVVQNRMISNTAGMPSMNAITTADAGTANAQAAGIGAAINANLVQLVNPLLPNLTTAMSGLRTVLDAAENAEVSHPTAVADGVVDSVIASVMGVSKLWSKTGKFGSGVAGDLTAGLGKLLEPLMLAQMADYIAQLESGQTQAPSWWPKWGGSKGSGISPDYPSTNYGGGPTGHRNDPIYTVQLPSGSGNQMPTSPTSPAPHTSMPMPGHASVAP